MSKIGLDNYSSNFKELQEAKRKYLLPQPRIDLGISLKNIANSMIDISDGLAQDATHLAKNSELTVELNLSKIPLPNINKIDKKSLIDDHVTEIKELNRFEKESKNSLNEISNQVIELTKNVNLNFNYVIVKYYEVEPYKVFSFVQDFQDYNLNQL